MLIINADDWGKRKYSTDKSLSCFKKNRITSVSAMVFMADSARSAELGMEHDLDIGLHLNYTLKLNGQCKSSKLKDYQMEIASFLLRSKYCTMIYNPMLRKQFDYVFKSQFEEYVRLYDSMPTHIDGHHHMHLCTNMIIDKIIPKGFKVRRKFTVDPGEKFIINRLYRRIINRLLMRRYICTDHLFKISPIQVARLKKLIGLAKSGDVELEVHPEKSEEYNFLMCDEYLRMISQVKIGPFSTFRM